MVVVKFTGMKYMISVVMECTIYSLFSGYPGSKSRIGTRLWRRWFFLVFASFQANIGIACHLVHYHFFEFFPIRYLYTAIIRSYKSELLTVRLNKQIRRRYKLQWYITDKAWLLWTKIINTVVSLTSGKPKNSSIVPRGPRQNCWLGWLQDDCERYSLALAGNKTAVFQFVVGHHANNCVFTRILKKSCWGQINQCCKISI
jgi:hypothetical protein